MYLQQFKGMQSSKQRMWKGYLIRENWYIKGYGVEPRGGASPRKNLLTTPPPPPRDRNAFYSEDLILMAKIHVTLLLEKINSEY